MHDMKENKKEFQWKIFRRIGLGDCSTIHVGGAHELFRRVIQQILLGGLSNRFYRNSVVCFREQKPFVLKTVFFSLLALTCVRESVRARDMGVGGLHSHPYHVDNQVGSCICLSMFGCHYMCT